FIGTNLAHRILQGGRNVLLFDNLSRPGVERNLAWLQSVYGERVEFLEGDVRHRSALREVVRRADQVYHFAAQVAVTTSLEDPVHDFEVNVGGTLNLLEELRALSRPVPLVFTSTNKVYGALNHLRLRRDGTRYEPEEGALRNRGVNEDCPRDFHSPYGCSKGAADQYVLDYTRSFGLPTVVFRMSCIYGPHQFGTEDQGWVAHFLICALQDRPLTLYGDGLQVRDILFVEDLAEALVLAQAHMKHLAGQAFNMGGGPRNTISLLELLELIADIHGQTPPVCVTAWRIGDQRYYVSDTSKFEAGTGWAPRVGVREGVTRLYEWLVQARGRPRRRLLAGKGSS
ncbi:MAG: NAD-dependent epimerase/dehydratase family protein, partial [Planctomycetes bacterium]|nr:NAD-dependent epimerase/dehydratase family protein [Planctomycetota bacterium]